MKLNELIEELKKLQAEGHGDLNVYYRGGADGSCGELSFPTVEDEVSDSGPFDEKDGAKWIELYAEQG